MAVSTVTQPTRNSSTAKAKTESKFWHRRRRSTPAAHAAPAEPDTFPHPDGDTQILPRATRAGADPARHAAPQVLYRERPADLDRAAYWIALEATNAGLHRWSAIKLEEALARHLAIVHRFANQERAEAQRLLARDGNGERAAAQAARTIEGAVQAAEEAEQVPGVSVAVNVDTATLGNAVATVTANEGDVTVRTAQFEQLTPEVLAQLSAGRVAASTGFTTIPPRATSSPTHVPGDGTTPPVPDKPVPGAEALPQRDPHRPVKDADGGESE